MADRRLLRRAGLLALAVAVVLCFAGVFQHGLWTPDEPREAEVGREMLLSHYSAMPTLGGVQFVEKPPLFAWITAAAYSVFGTNDWAGRIPAAIFSIGSIWIAYLLGKRAAGRLAGLCSAVVLATMWQFAETSHKAALDDALMFFVAAGHLAFLSLWKSSVRSQAPYGGYAAIGVCAGLAFMTKGFIGPALMCAPPFLAAAAMGDWGFVKRVLPLAAVAAVVGVAAFGLPWVLALAHTPGGGWPAVKTCLWTNTIGRSVTIDDADFGAHKHNPFYYLYTWITVLAPWTLAVPAALMGGTLRRDVRGGRTLFLGLVFVAGLVLLSLPSGKRELYLLPLLPAASVVPGVWLSRFGSKSGWAWDVVAVRTIGVLAAAALLTPGIAAIFYKSDWFMSRLSEPVRESLLGHEKTIVGHVILGLGMIGLFGGILRRWCFRIPTGAKALQLAYSLVFVTLYLHACVWPATDCLRDMSAGVREVASLVPADEPILLLHSDETMRAAIPFYTGREVENAVEVKNVLAALDAGRAKHLVVMDKHDEKITSELRARLVLVKNVRINASRTMDVYEVRAP